MQRTEKYFEKDAFRTECLWALDGGKSALYRFLAS